MCHRYSYEKHIEVHYPTVSVKCPITSGYDRHCTVTQYFKYLQHTPQCFVYYKNMQHKMGLKDISIKGTSYHISRVNPYAFM